MKIVIGGPVRNRGWILQRHLDSLKEMEIPEGVEAVFCYLINDSTDNTQKILNENQIPYASTNTHHPSGSIRGQYSYENLANLRNQYLALCFNLLQANAVLSIDSDILVPKNALKQLVEDDCDIVSMLLCNQPLPIEMRRAHNVMNETGNGLMKHIYEFPIDTLFPCDLTGACYLIKKPVWDAGARYAQDVQGEDIPFCRDAKQKGFGIYCDSRIRPIHVMNEGQEIIAGRIIKEGMTHD